VFLVLWQSLDALNVPGAGDSLAAAWGRAAGVLARHGRTILITAVVFVVGAVGGAAMYHVRLAVRHHSSHGRRVRRTEPDE